MRVLRPLEIGDQLALDGQLVELDERVAYEEEAVALRRGERRVEARIVGQVVVLDQRQVDPGEGGELDPRPRAAVDLEQLVLIVARVVLELHLADAVKARRLEQQAGLADDHRRRQAQGLGDAGVAVGVRMLREFAPGVGAQHATLPVRIGAHRVERRRIAGNVFRELELASGVIARQRGEEGVERAGIVRRPAAGRRARRPPRCATTA